MRQLEIDSVDRLSLANDHVEARRCRPILVIDVDRVGLAWADLHFIRPIGRRGRPAVAGIYAVPGTDGTDFDARGGLAIRADDPSADGDCSG